MPPHLFSSAARSPARRLTLAAAVAAMVCAAAARAEEIDYKKLYARVAPGVVVVYGESGAMGSIGSGSIIRSDGLVVTNAHVILNHDTGKPWEKLFVFLKPDKVTGNDAQDLKRSYQAQWLTYSAALDLALVRIVDAPAGLPVVQLSDDRNIGVGEDTAAIGHPEHGAKWSLTTGRIGGEWSDFDGVKGKDVYQMETSVNRGNSGGPLLDGNGNMIGINTSIARRAADGLAITGVNFAIKSAVVRKWIGETSQQIAAAPVPPEEHAPPPAAVAKAEPAPAAQETVPPALTPPAPPHSEIAPAGEVAPAVQISTALPPPPPPGKRGFVSHVTPGRILSPTELVLAHAQDAMDDLGAETARHSGHRAGK